MTQALLLSALLLLSAPPKKAPPSRYAAAQAEFARGDLIAALRDLDAAVNESPDDATLSKIHLMRGQCYGAQRDLVKAEQAFEKALESDPEAKLDPTRVDPSLVALLDGLRERLQGDIEVRTDKAAKIALDGGPLGPSPVKATVSIGRHKLEAFTADGRYSASSSVVIASKRTTSVDMQLAEVPREVPVEPGHPGGSTTPSSSVQVWGGRPYGDLRLALDPFGVALTGPDIEFGAGLEWAYLRASVSFRFFPGFGIAPSGGLVLPVGEQVKVFAELELPFLIGSGTSPIAIGLGGAAGGEYFVTKWLSGYAQIGARNYFIPGSLALVLQAGLRMRLP